MVAVSLACLCVPYWSLTLLLRVKINFLHHGTFAQPYKSRQEREEPKNYPHYRSLGRQDHMRVLMSWMNLERNVTSVSNPRS